jgi:hypothetical protein
LGHIVFQSERLNDAAQCSLLIHMALF